MQDAIPVVLFQKQFSGFVILSPAAVFDIVLVVTFGYKNSLLVKSLPLPVFRGWCIFLSKQSSNHLFPHSALTRILHNATHRTSLSEDDIAAPYHNSNTDLLPGVYSAKQKKPGLHIARIVSRPSRSAF